MKTGDKVVCINGQFTNEDRCVFQNLPEEGRVYCIHRVVVGEYTMADGVIVRDPAFALLLVGLHNRPFPMDLEPAFDARRFITLEEAKLRASRPAAQGDADQSDLSGSWT
jgi:hypothetical protein